MPLQQVRNVNFGKNRANATGSTGVGYALLDVSGSTVAPRTTSGVYQLTSGSGIYAAYISFPTTFRGQILWDTGTAFPTASYAAEQYNVEENNPRVDETWQLVHDVTGAINALYDMQFGRWHISNNQMRFYAPDNSTLIAVFNLFDDNGNPTMDAVFQRVKV